MGYVNYVSDTARTRTHNLVRAGSTIGHSDGHDVDVLFTITQQSSHEMYNLCDSCIRWEDAVASPWHGGMGGFGHPTYVHNPLEISANQIKKIHKGRGVPRMYIVTVTAHQQNNNCSDPSLFWGWRRHWATVASPAQKKVTGQMTFKKNKTYSHPCDKSLVCSSQVLVEEPLHSVWITTWKRTRMTTSHRRARGTNTS